MLSAINSVRSENVERMALFALWLSVCFLFLVPQNLFGAVTQPHVQAEQQFELDDALDNALSDNAIVITEAAPHLIEQVVDFVLPDPAIMTPVNYLEALVALAQFPAEMAPSRMTGKDSVQAALMVRDFVHVLHGLLSIHNHGVNRYNLPWLINDTLSFSRTFISNAHEVQKPVLIKLELVYLLGEAGLSCIAALRDDKSIECLAAQSCASLVRCLRLYMSHASVNNTQKLKLGLVIMNALSLLGHYRGEALEQKATTHNVYAKYVALAERYREDKEVMDIKLKEMTDQLDEKNQELLTAQQNNPLSQAQRLMGGGGQGLGNLFTGGGLQGLGNLPQAFGQQPQPNPFASWQI